MNRLLHHGRSECFCRRLYLSKIEHETRHRKKCPLDICGKSILKSDCAGPRCPLIESTGIEIYHKSLFRPYGCAGYSGALAHLST